MTSGQENEASTRGITCSSWVDFRRTIEWSAWKERLQSKTRRLFDWANLITDVQVAELLEEQLGYPHIRLHNYPFDQTLLKLIPKEYVQEKNIVPLKREKNKLFLAISDPLDYFTLNDVRLMTGFEVEPVIVVKDEIRQAF